jgi:hypothetical protein
VVLIKNKKHAERTLTHLGGATNTKILCLKQTTDFKSTQHENTKIIILKKLKQIHVATA